MLSMRVLTWWLLLLLLTWIVACPALVHAADREEAEEREELTTSVLFLIMLIFLGGTFFLTFEKSIPVPHTVVLFVHGILVGFIARVLLPQVGSVIGEIPPDLLFFIFLPVLIFEGSFAMNSYALRCVFGQTALLATLGLLVNTFLLSLICKVLVGSLSWYSALLLGSLLSATDPVAVVSLLKKLRVSKYLSAMVDGEAVMNDGTAMILFTLLLPAATQGTFNESLWRVLLSGARLLFLPLAVGPAFGWMQVFWLRRAQEPLTKACITLSMSYISYYISSKLLQAGGVLTLCLEGVYMSAYYPSLFPGSESSFVAQTWLFVVHFANTVLFSLVGVILVEDVVPTLRWMDLLVTIFLYIGVVICRFLMLEGMLPLLNRFPRPFGHAEVLLLTHAGLRGGVAVTLALAVSLSDAEHGVVMLKYTTGIVFFSLIVNATTAEYVVEMLGFNAKPQHYHTMMAYNMKRLKEVQTRALQDVKRDTKYKNTDWHMVERYLHHHIRNPFRRSGIEEDHPDAVLNRTIMSSFKATLWLQREELIISETVIVELSFLLNRLVERGELFSIRQLRLFRRCGLFSAFDDEAVVVTVPAAEAEDERVASASSADRFTAAVASSRRPAPPHWGRAEGDRKLCEREEAMRGEDVTQISSTPTAVLPHLLRSPLYDRSTSPTTVVVADKPRSESLRSASPARKGTFFRSISKWGEELSSSLLGPSEKRRRRLPVIKDETEMESDEEEDVQRDEAIEMTDSFLSHAHPSVEYNPTKRFHKHTHDNANITNDKNITSLTTESSEDDDDEEDDDDDDEGGGAVVSSRFPQGRPGSPDPLPKLGVSVTAPGRSASTSPYRDNAAVHPSHALSGSQSPSDFLRHASALETGVAPTTEGASEQKRQVMRALLPRWVVWAERVVGEGFFKSIHRRAQENGFMLLLAIVKCLTALEATRFQYVVTPSDAYRVDAWLREQLHDSHACIAFFYRHFPEATSCVSSARAVLSVARSLETALDTLRQQHGCSLSMVHQLHHMIQSIRNGLTTPAWEASLTAHSAHRAASASSSLRASPQEMNLVMQAVASSTLGKGLRRAEINAITCMGLVQSFKESEVITLPPNAFMVVVFGSLRTLRHPWATAHAAHDQMESFGDIVGLNAFLFPPSQRQIARRRWEVITEEAKTLLISFNSVQPFLTERSLRSVTALWRAAAVEAILPLVERIITLPMNASGGGSTRREQLTNMILAGSPRIGPEECNQTDLNSPFHLCFYLRGTDSRSFFSLHSPPCHVSSFFFGQVQWVSHDVVLYIVPVQISNGGYVPWDKPTGVKPPAPPASPPPPPPASAPSSPTPSEEPPNASWIASDVGHAGLLAWGGGAAALAAFEAQEAARGSRVSGTPHHRRSLRHGNSAYRKTDLSPSALGSTTFSTALEALNVVLRGEVPTSASQLGGFDASPSRSFGDTTGMLNAGAGPLPSISGFASPLDVSFAMLPSSPRAVRGGGTTAAASKLTIPPPSWVEAAHEAGLPQGVEVGCVLQCFPLLVTPVPLVNRLIASFASLLEQLCIAALRYVAMPSDEVNIRHAQSAGDRMMDFLRKFSMEIGLLLEGLSRMLSRDAGMDKGEGLTDAPPPKDCRAALRRLLGEGRAVDAEFCLKVCVWGQHYRQAGGPRRYHLRNMILGVRSYANQRFEGLVATVKLGAELFPSLRRMESVARLQKIISSSVADGSRVPDDRRGDAKL